MRKATKRAALLRTAVMRRALGLGLAAVMGLGLVACEPGIPAGREPHYEFNWTDMGDQPKIKPQRVDMFGAMPMGTLAPPEGVVAIDQHPYRFSQAEAELAGKMMKNPYEATPEVLAKGEHVWTNFCIACHGPTGAGDGHVTKLFPKPPHLARQKPRDWTDGRIFHVPYRGQGSMPSHVRQLDDDELWAVVHWIRKMQSDQPVAPPTEDDLKELKR